MNQALDERLNQRQELLGLDTEVSLLNMVSFE